MAETTEQLAETNIDRVEILKAKDGQWYFNAIASNGEIIATSEQYTRMSDAKSAAAALHPGVPKVERTKGKMQTEIPVVSRETREVVLQELVALGLISQKKADKRLAKIKG